MQSLRLRYSPALVALYLFRTRVLRNFVLIASVAGLFVFANQAGFAQTVETSTFLDIIDPTVTEWPPAPVSIAMGNVAILRAIVTANSELVTTGQVAFCDVTGGAPCRGVHVLGIAQLNSIGQARFTFRPPLGQHLYQAVFLGKSQGSTAYTRSASYQLLLPVFGNLPTTTTIASSPIGSDPGPYTLTALVSETGTRIPPAGDITFYDQTRGNLILATGALAPPTFALSFSNTSNPEVAVDPKAIVSADFNDDAIPDLAVANYETGTVTILQGDGTGGYTATASLYTGLPGLSSYPTSLVVADFDSNGLPDLAVTNFGDRTVTIVLTFADGAFAPLSNWPSPTGAGPASIATGDFNGDGIADLATANSEDNTVTILLGNGDGMFAPPSSPFYSTPHTGRHPQALAIADFSGDRIADLAVANAQDNTVSILLGVGDGTFVAGPPPLVTGGNPRSIAVGDFNNDGIADLATANLDNNTATILLGNENGTFHASPSSPSATGLRPGAIAVGDVDGDGEADLVIANQYGNDPTGQSAGSVTILRGRGDGTFTPYSSPLNTAFAPVSVALRDFNGDGFSDIAVVNSLGIGVDPGSNGTITILDAVITSTAESVVSDITPVGTAPHQVFADYGGDDTSNPSASNPITLQSVPVVPALTLSVSSPSSAYGLDVIFTAALDPWKGSGFDASGEPVTFYVNVGSGEIALGSGLLSGDPQTPWVAAIATLKSRDLPAGTVTLRASYAGNMILSGASATIPNYLVLPSVATATTLTITSGTPPAEVSSVLAGEPVTLTASVVSGSTPLTTGQVDFCDATAAHCSDLHRLGTAQLTAAGTATLRLRPGVGSHSYRAVFHPTPHAATAYDGSSSVPVSLTVAPAVNERHPTVTTMSLDPGSTGGDYSLIATVVGTGGATLLPGGTVSLLDVDNGNASLGSGALNAVGIDVTFNSSDGPVTGLQPVSATVGDFNGDATPDIAIANSGDDNLTILMGNGDGTFASLTSPQPSPFDPSSLATGDFNADGIADLAVANRWTNTATILLGNGDGTFAPPSSPSYSPPATGRSPRALAIGDFDRDGVADIAAVNDTDNTVTILLGNGDGTFTPAASSPSTGESPRSMVVGDFNDDGASDLAIADLSTHWSDQPLTILLSRGDGTFSPAPSSPIPSLNPRSIAVGDLDQDGNSDLAVVNSDGNNIVILLGHGDGTFAPPSSPSYSPPTTGSIPMSVSLADFNNDGVSDLAVSGRCPDIPLCGNQGTMTILLGNGDGTFRPNAFSPDPGSLPVAIATADFNGDGSPDLLAVNLVSDSTTVLLSSVAATARTTISHVNPIGRSVQHNVIASYEGDANFAPSVSSGILLEGSQVTTTLSLAANLPSSTYGQPVTLTATLSPWSAGALSTDGQTVAFSNSGALIGTATLSGGVSTLDVSTLPVGTSDLQASYSGDADFAGSSSVVLPYVVEQATPALSLNCYSGVFDGAPHGCAGTATGVGGAPVDGTWSYDPVSATNVGATAVVGAFTSLDTNYASGTTAGSIVITQATPVVTVAAVSDRVLVQNAITFTSTVNSPAGAPTGAVSFLEGSTTLGSGALSGGTATFTTSSLAVGSHSITARYSGDANFAASDSTVLTETVIDVLVDIPSTRSVTVARGSSATLDLSILPSSGSAFPSSITLALTGLPGGVTATMISPAWTAQSGTVWSLPAGTAIAGNTRISIRAPQALAAARPAEIPEGSMTAPLAIAAFLLPCVGFCFGGKRHKQALYTLLLAVAFAGVIGLSACGGGGSEPPPTRPQPITSTINVTVSSGPLTRTTTFTLTVN